MATKRTRATQYRNVRILIRGSDIDVIPRCGELQCGTNEQIEWLIYPPDLDFTVKFNKRTGGSPFKEKVFTRHNNISGPLIVNLKQVGKDRFYRYSLKVKGYKLIDPGVIIWK
jgi:hypothetical protein